MIRESRTKASEKYGLAKEAFFTKGEKKQFKEVMENPEDQQIHADLLKVDAEKLYKKAMKLIDRVESGEFNEEQMVKVEYMIAHLLAAISDFELELTLEMPEEQKKPEKRREPLYNMVITTKEKKTAKKKNFHKKDVFYEDEVPLEF